MQLNTKKIKILSGRKTFKIMNEKAAVCIETLKLKVKKFLPIAVILGVS